MALPGNRLPCWQERTKPCDALEHQRAETPVVHSDGVLLPLYELWSLGADFSVKVLKCWEEIRRRCVHFHHLLSIVEFPQMMCKDCFGPTP